MIAASLTICLSAQAADAAPPQTLGAYRNKNRVLLIFAPSAADARFMKQNDLLKGKQDGLKDRDLVRIHIFEKPGSRLREIYGVKSGDFQTVLVGKDGHTAYRTEKPVTTSDLFQRIDRMPMRRDEMRQRGR
jgi:hypothetical protein